MIGLAIWLAVIVIVLAWLLFRKGGYKRVPLDTPPGPQWVQTEERFVDPSSGETSMSGSTLQAASVLTCVRGHQAGSNAGFLRLA